MDDKEKIKKIRSLNYFEVRVLYYRKKGLSNTQLRHLIKGSESSHANLLRETLTKLVIPLIPGKEKQRLERFVLEFGDIFDKFIPDEASLKSWPVDGYQEEKTAPNPPEEPPISPKPPVEESQTYPESPTDTSSNPKVKNPTLTESTIPPNRPKWLPAFMACSILGIIAIIILILAILLIREIRPANQIPPTIVSSTDDLESITPTDSLVQVIPTNTVQPIHTETPTITPFPTLTLIPTATIQPTPIIRTMFFDNFDTGLNSAWQVLSGKPTIVDGYLTTSEDTWLKISDSSWKNYLITFDFYSNQCWLSSDYYNAIGVRGNSTSDMVVFIWAHCNNEWDIVTSGHWNTVPNTNTDDGNYGTNRYTIEVIENKFTASVQDSFNKQIVLLDMNLPSGTIFVKLARESKLDNFKVVEIP